MPGIVRAWPRWTGLVLVLLASACAPGAPGQVPQPTGGAPTYPPPLPADEQVTITFEDYNLASAGIGREATLKMLDEFHQQHPNITVEPKATADQQMFST